MRRCLLVLVTIIALGAIPSGARADSFNRCESTDPFGFAGYCTLTFTGNPVRVIATGNPCTPSFYLCLYLGELGPSVSLGMDVIGHAGASVGRSTFRIDCYGYGACVAEGGMDVPIGTKIHCWGEGSEGANVACSSGTPDPDDTPQAANAGCAGGHAVVEADAARSVSTGSCTFTYVGGKVRAVALATSPNATVVVADGIPYVGMDHVDAGVWVGGEYCRMRDSELSWCTLEFTPDVLPGTKLLCEGVPPDAAALSRNFISWGGAAATFACGSGF